MSTPPGAATVEHWAYQVASPFRQPVEIRELTSAPARPSSESEARGAGDLDAEAEFEAYDELDLSSEADADQGEALLGEDLLEEATGTDHPLASVFTLPRLAFDAMAKGGWATAIAIAVGAGERDPNKLTNMVFWFRHPQLIGQKLRRDQVELAREWVEIRDGIVRPALAGGQPATTGSAGGATTTVSPTSGGRTAISADGLRWWGPPAQESPELMAFMRKVYAAHVRRSNQPGNSFVDTLPRSALDVVEGGHLARADAAAKAREMLAAARARLAVEGLSGTVRIGVLSAYRSADLQYAIWQGQTTKGKGGFPHYYEVTRATRRRREYGGEHSDKAAEHLAQYMGGYVAAPGYSNHQDGLALDLGTRKDEPADLAVGRRKGLIKLYTGSWFHTWLRANARTFHFEPLATEPWHWVYRPPKQSSEAETWIDEAAPTGVSAGSLEVPKVAVLASHRGRGPDLLLGWNAMPAVPTEIDVVLHLHGYSFATMTLPKNMAVWAGLDLTPVDGAAGTGRTRPTLTVLPRGHFTGVKSGRLYRYTFPALTTASGLTDLVRESLRLFGERAGGTPPRLGRLILTAHSGGGAPLMQILRRHDPQEVHVFDGLYQDATPLAEWARRHITADRGAVGSGGAPSGAMRVFFGPSTRGYSRRLQQALAGVLDGAPAAVGDRYRVEGSTLGHWQIARQYGWRVLTDPSADVPDAARVATRRSAVRREDELDAAESPLPAEAWDEAEALDAGGSEWEVEESGELDTEGWSLQTEDLSDEEGSTAGPEGALAEVDAAEALDLMESSLDELGSAGPAFEELDELADLELEDLELADLALDGEDEALEEGADLGTELLESGSAQSTQQDPDAADIAERVAAALARRSRTRLEAEQQVPRARWTTCFTAADANRAIRTFEDNVAAADAASYDRCSCIVMLNVAIGALLDLPTKSWPARGYKPATMARRPRQVRMADLTTATIERAMRQLVRAGRATGPVRIDFTDRRGRRAGTLAPVALAASVRDAIVARTPDAGCWYAFGMSLLDGYHSVLLLVDRTGPNRRIYWMDQFSSGLGREVTTTLDDEITSYTQSAWASVLRDKNKRFSTPVRLWPLRKRTTS